MKEEPAKLQGEFSIPTMINLVVPPQGYPVFTPLAGDLPLPVFGAPCLVSMSCGRRSALWSRPLMRFNMSIRSTLLLMLGAVYLKSTNPIGASVPNVKAKDGNWRLIVQGNRGKVVLIDRAKGEVPTSFTSTSNCSLSSLLSFGFAFLV
ncbi:hypothetical protein ACOSP7_027085 [Xanthoceras sorbifolium]